MRLSPQLLAALSRAWPDLGEMLVICNVELNTALITRALIGDGYLLESQAGDHQQVEAALQRLVDDWVRGTGPLADIVAA